MSKSRSRTSLAQKLLKRGMNYQKEGRVHLAEECYRNALKANPRSAEALRLWGMLALHVSRCQEAIGLINAALALNPDDPTILTSLAESYRAQGEMEEAIRYYRRVVELCPQSAQAHSNLGQAEELVGYLEAAAESFRRALELQPDTTEANCNLARILRRQGNFPEALRLCEKGVALNPGRSETYDDLGLVHTDMKNLAAADEAFQRAHALNPNSAVTALTRSYLSFKRGDIPAAADSLRRAIKLDPKMHLSHLALGSVLCVMADWAGALESYERARALCPNSADVIFYLGLLHLLQGNFVLGWDEYEYREEARTLRRRVSRPQWKGEALQGARILLHCEQGLGDTLQAVRYVPLVAARGGQVVLAVQRSLHRLLAGTEGAWQVISEGETVSNFPWFCPLLSLPLAFATELKTIPAKIPYVYADLALIKVWGQRLQGNSLRVGLVWGGDPKHPHDLRRSIPLEQLAPLTHVEGATFYSLQVGGPAAQLQQLGSRTHLIDLQHELKDFADTAAVVANLDLVISVDTSVVHLAGAMGKPVWILLPISPDWRWLLEREDSPWYPTARLFRQSTLGNWEEVLTRVERELRELVAASGTGTLACALNFADKLNPQAELAGLQTAQARVPVPPTLQARVPVPPTPQAGVPVPPTPQARVPVLPNPQAGAPVLPAHVRSLISKGIQLQRAGRTGEAEACYRECLEADPRCHQALLLLGLLAQQAGQYRESIRLIEESLALSPDDPDALNNLADSYLGLGQTQPASRCYQRLAELFPQSATAHRRLAELHERDGDWEAATASHRRELELQPDSPEANCKLANFLRHRGDLREALRLCEYAVTLNPARFETYNELGVVLTDMMNLGAAAEAFERSLALKPDSALTALDRSYFLGKSGDLPAAAESLRRAIVLDPRMHRAHLSLGCILTMLGDWAGALESYERARSLSPNSADVIFYLGLLHLLQGNFALGWGEYEQREEARQLRKKFSQPQWKGEPLQGARILLHSMQGLGDILQAVRYVPLVAARGGQAVLVVPSALYRLLERTEGAWQVIREGEVVPDFHWHCPLLSLPLAFGTELNTIPGKVPYIYPDPALAKAWGQRMLGNSLRIGLVWGGDPKHPHDLRRSIPLEQLASLTHIEGTTFYSLQIGAPSGQLKDLGSRAHLIDLQQELKDFADTAAIVDNLDLVISVDTSVVHLAGAMGKAVWVLLPFSPDWRWLLDREDSPWYPTARLFRQSTLGNWQEVVTRLERELRELVAAGGTGTLACALNFADKLNPQAELAAQQTTQAGVPVLPPNVRRLLRKGIKHERAGRVGQAEAYYRKCLEAEPRCAQALLLLALLAQQAGQYAESIRLTGRALALNPDDSETLRTLADAYMGQGEIEPASHCYQRLAEIFPQSAEAHQRLGRSQEELGEWEAATESYRRALELQPDSAAANCKLAEVLRRRGDLPEALRLCEYAVTLNPDRFETYSVMGLVLTDMKDLAGAGEAFQHSLALNPDSAVTALTRGYLFFKSRNIPAAADTLRRAITLDPKMHLAHLELGCALTTMGEWAGALESYERARSLCPNSADAIFYLGFMHLLLGNFALGWGEYEQREEARKLRKKFPQPQWKGEPLQGARILLHSKQGLGDILQAVRYVPLVAARGGQVVLVVPSSLYRLLARTEGAWQVLNEGETVPDFRWHSPLFSLPLAFATELSTIPAKIPYVYPDPALAKTWGQRLLGNSLRVGLVWGGDPNHPHDFWRSITLEQLAPLTNVEGATFYSLQRGAPAGQLQQSGSHAHLIDLQHELKDFADTAAIVANLDLVISVDTSVVHLAGAMGKPVWVLLPKSPDWRWLLEREDSPWYPTARLFRQSTMGDWQEVVARVERELRELVTRTTGSTGTLACVTANSDKLTTTVSTVACGPESLNSAAPQAGVPVLPLRVRDLLIKGIKHQRAVQMGKAEACYRECLEADPRCPQALHLLGLLAQQAGQYQESIRLIGEALAVNPDDPDTLKSLAVSYVSQGQMKPASLCYQRLTELFPQSAEAHHLLGKSLEGLGEWEAATASYGRALALQPNSPDLYGSLARQHSKQGAFREAVEYCRRALALDPNNHEIYIQIGNALTDLGDYSAAVEAHRRALALKPDSAAAVYGLGYFFERKGDLNSAVDAYWNALKLNPRLGAAYLHLGITYHLQGDLGKAAECCDQVRKLEPDSAEACSLLGLIHLQQGNYRSGFSEYEARWSTPFGFRFRRKFSQPLWRGESLEGSRILLHAEQGLGDTLQFVRYVPLVAARGGKVVLEVQPRLHRLLAPTPGVEKVICRGEALPEFHWQCPLLSLPLAFATELNTIPARIPYLHLDPAQVEAWGQRLRGKSLRIGLVWAGDPNHPQDHWRSIPLGDLAPLTNLAGAALYSLQVGAAAGQIKQLGPRVHLIDLQDELKDFADTAAVVANLDLVISVDTAVVHLAGAMGKPVWVLVQRSADWRWLLEREDSPWYPTVRLFRQSKLGIWQDVVARVEQELRRAVTSGKGSDE